MLQESLLLVVGSPNRWEIERRPRLHLSNSQNQTFHGREYLKSGVRNCAFAALSPFPAVGDCSDCGGFRFLPIRWTPVGSVQVLMARNEKWCRDANCTSWAYLSLPYPSIVLTSEQPQPSNWRQFSIHTLRNDLLEEHSSMKRPSRRYRIHRWKPSDFMMSDLCLGIARFWLSGTPHPRWTSRCRQPDFSSTKSTHTCIYIYNTHTHIYILCIYIYTYMYVM